MDDFIADLHHIGHRVGLAKGGDRIARVFEDGLDQLVVRFVLPGLGRELFRRIGPGVGIVEVNKEFEALLLRLFRQGDRVFQVVRKSIRRMEQPETNPVVAMILEDLESGLCLAVVLENAATLLCLRKKGNVGSDGVIKLLGHGRCGREQGAAANPKKRSPAWWSKANRMHHPGP